jgi:hypothetical protein
MHKLNFNVTYILAMKFRPHIDVVEYTVQITHNE